VDHADVGEASVLLRLAQCGNREAQDKLLDAVYFELHRIAQRVFSSEHPGHTLQPTALISELYIRMMHGATIEWRDTAHFYRTAARTFRRILVDHARARHAQRRPNPRDRVQLDDVFVYSEERAYEVIELEEALALLEKQDPTSASIMELRYLTGFTIEETARVLDISPTTVKEKHAFARAWLKAFLDGTLPAA
jgi:RNA polymerase sigma-70 factor (ECF subfamily)